MTDPRARPPSSVSERPAPRCLLVALLLAVALGAGGGDAAAQALYRQPSVEERTEVAGEDGVLPQPFLALTNANVVDVRNGGVREGVTVVVRDGTIVSVGTEPPPEGAERVDLRGFFVTPGLFEGHYHGSSVESARRALASGVTTVKSASVRGFSDIQQREMVEQGYLAGPDVLAASVYVMPTLGESDDVLADPRLYKYANRPVRGEEAVREVVRVNADRGVDWIKTRSAGLTSGTSGPDPLSQVYSDAELRAIVDEAARFDIPVECHAHGAAVVIAAVEAGCASIEHGSYVDEEGLRLMKERGTIWIPTYVSLLGFELPHDDYTTTIARQRHPYLVDNMARMIRRGHEMGITILTAVDTGYGPESVYRVAGEVNAFVDFGMTPLEALQAATVHSAEAYGLGDRTGAVEPGLDADLVVFDRNPLAHPGVLHDPLMVMSNGRVGVNRRVGSARVMPGHPGGLVR